MAHEASRPLEHKKSFTISRPHQELIGILVLKQRPFWCTFWAALRRQIEHVVLVDFSPWKGLAFLGKSDGGCFVFCFKLHECNLRLNPFCIRYDVLGTHTIPFLTG